MREESELVTGEAVVLDLRVAKLGSRAVAMLLDVLVQLVLLLALFIVLATTVAGTDDSLAGAIFLVGLVLILVGYPVLFETLSRGRSLGKLALGLRVVRTDGGPIRFRHALARGLGGFVLDFWALGLFGAVAVIVSLCSANGRRVGDFLAGTVVIRERVPENVYVGLPMPPGLGAWASQLDLSRLTNDVALASRQFLSRFHELRPEAAEVLGQSLAHQVAAQIGTPIPPGIPVWAFLAAVLAERRNRDQARAMQAAPYPGAPVQPGFAPPQTPAQPIPASPWAAPPAESSPYGRPAETPAEPASADSPFTPPS
ncbi:MAG TPA: RDD family protein [Amycolatopsis sp.]|nr:RDD family protein [Amycolatopsis sp.]